jgi:uncharacterized membrane protein
MMFNPLKELQRPFVQRLLILILLALLALLLAWAILFCGSAVNSHLGLLNPYGAPISRTDAVCLSGERGIFLSASRKG